MIERSTIVITDCDNGTTDLIENLSLRVERLRTLVFAFPRGVMEIAKFARISHQTDTGIHIFSTVPTLARASLFNLMALNGGNILSFRQLKSGAFVVASLNEQSGVDLPPFESLRINVNLPPQIAVLKVPYDLLEVGGQDDYTFITSES